MSADHDARVRTAAFSFLTFETQLRGDVLPYEVLRKGFTFEGQRVPLLGPQGIFKPAVLSEMPLSITTAPIVEGKPRPYEDEIGPDGFLIYRYRGTDAAHRDNVGLRLAMTRQAPLVYLHGIVPGEYLAFWPVYVVGDYPGRLSFEVAVDERFASPMMFTESAAVTEIRRRYVTTIAVRRLHQESFRQRVLDAYRDKCAVCRLRHDQLLDAAHILPDNHPFGEPVVPNGLALCKLHHAAFDRHILGITPDLVVEIRRDILDEPDGPMLRHGLQGFHGSRIRIPTSVRLQPNREFLAERYAIFVNAG